MRILLLSILAVLLILPTTMAIATDVGKEAPELRGTSTQGEVSLSNYRGKKHVVLALFFRAFTPV